MFEFFSLDKFLSREKGRPHPTLLTKNNATIATITFTPFKQQNLFVFVYFQMSMAFSQELHDNFSTFFQNVNKTNLPLQFLPSPEYPALHAQV